MKPNKIYYKNQKEILKKFLAFIKPLLLKNTEIKEAFLWGSLAKGELGIYEKPYRGNMGSDVDLVLFLEEDSETPKNWKNLNDPHSWFNVYKDDEFRRFEYDGNIHKVDLLVAHKGKTVKDLEEDNAKVNKKFKKLK